MTDDELFFLDVVSKTTDLEVMKDLETLWTFQRNKLADLGEPAVSCQAWCAFIVEYPAAWKTLVKSLHLTSMSLDAAVDKTPAN